jgi:hypothetical protein
LSVALFLALALAACSDDADDTGAVRTTPAPKQAVYQIARLGVTDRVPPQQWLASRQAGRDLPEDDPDVIKFKRTLEIGSRRFREYPRMIANRAVELETMLKQKNLAEPALQLIERLSRVPGDTRHVESFGALCQQYFNLRMQGLDPEQAVKVLQDGAGASN